MEDEHDYLDYYMYNYTDYQDESFFPIELTCVHEASCISVVVILALISLLGFVGNGLVIWISGFKMKKTVNTTWYLSLAISDFVFCAFLPLYIASIAMETWVFRGYVCKLILSIMPLNMFSSIFLLVAISIDCCMSVMFPVWSQNNRTVHKASVAVVVAWVLAIIRSRPSRIWDVETYMGRTICFSAYTRDPNDHKILVFGRFLVGFVVPFLISIFSYSIIILKFRNSRNSKPFKVKLVLVAAFFVCWLPYNVFVLLELNYQEYNYVLSIGPNVGTCMAAANSFLNPVLYVFMGNDLKRKFCSSVLSKMENAMADENPTRSQYLSSSTNSVEGTVSTQI